MKWGSAQLIKIWQRLLARRENSRAVGGALTTADAWPCAVKALRHVIGYANEDIACLIFGQTAAWRDSGATSQTIHDNGSDWRTDGGEKGYTHKKQIVMRWRNNSTQSPTLRRRLQHPHIETGRLGVYGFLMKEKRFSDAWKECCVCLGNEKNWPCSTSIICFLLFIPRL